LALALPALFAGLVTARAEYPFGPHEAVWEVTLDSQATLDLGPLGAAVMPSDLPGPLGYLGAKVSVGPIPESLTTAPSGDLESLSAPEVLRELERYGQAYLGVEASVRHAAAALARDALTKAAAFLAGGLVLVVVSAVGLGRARLGEFGDWVRRRRAVAVVAALGVGLGGAGSVWAGAASARPDFAAGGDPLLAGTPFRKAHLTGRLGQLVSQYGQVALGAYRDTESFYAQAASAVDEVFAAQARQAAESAEAGGAMGRWGLPADPSASAGASQSTEATPSPAPWLTGEGPYGDLTVAVFFSDLHCNVGMAQVVGAAAEASGAALVLDGGDTTMDGTSVERYCVDAVADAIPNDVPWVVAPGNHDTAATRDQERAAGALVLDGSVEQVEGVAILGDKDPTHTELAQGTRLTGDETVADVGRRLAEAACDAGDVDLVMVHDPTAALAALESGCVPAAVSGHTHARSGPRPVGGGVAYVQSSTGRDTREKTTVGPLQAPAEITVMLFDQSGRWVAWQLLSVHPDASAELSAIQAVPPPKTEGVAATTGASTSSRQPSQDPWP
jgi:hypothetical protein